MAFVFSTAFPTGRDISTSAYVGGEIIDYLFYILPGNAAIRDFEFTLRSQSRIVTAIDISLLPVPEPYLFNGMMTDGAAPAPASMTTTYTITVTRGSVTIFNQSGELTTLERFRLSETVVLPEGTHTYTITVQNTGTPGVNAMIELSSFITVCAVG